MKSCGIVDHKNSHNSLGQLFRLRHFRQLRHSAGMRIGDDDGSAPYQMRFYLGETLGGGECGKSTFMGFKTQIRLRC